MPRLVSPMSDSKLDSSQLQLTLTISGNYTTGFNSAYSQNRIRCAGPVETLTIALINQASGVCNASFQDYACSNPDAFTTQARVPFMPGTTGVQFDIGLRPNELIDFVMFVVLTDPTGAHPPIRLFCDPQVGNDPD